MGAVMIRQDIQPGRQALVACLCIISAQGTRIMWRRRNQVVPRQLCITIQHRHLRCLMFHAACSALCLKSLLHLRPTSLLAQQTQANMQQHNSTASGTHRYVSLRST